MDEKLRARIAELLQQQWDIAVIATVLGCRFADVLAVQDSLPKPVDAATLPLAMLDLPETILLLLDDAGIITVGDLLKLTPEELGLNGDIGAGTFRIGPVRAEAIRAELRRLGLKLGMNANGRKVFVEEKRDAALWERAAEIQKESLREAVEVIGPRDARYGRSAIAVRVMLR